MILNDAAIERCLADEEIIIFPTPSPDDIRNFGIRIHLGSTLMVPEPTSSIDPSKPLEVYYNPINILKEDFVLYPGGFLLGATKESIQTSPSLVCFLEGKSALARLGLTIHNTCMLLDGRDKTPMIPVLEIKNGGNTAIFLRAGMPIGMFCFFRVEGPSMNNQRAHAFPNSDDTPRPVFIRPC